MAPECRNCCKGCWAEEYEKYGQYCRVCVRCRVPEKDAAIAEARAELYESLALNREMRELFDRAADERDLAIRKNEQLTDEIKWWSGRQVSLLAEHGGKK